MTKRDDGGPAFPAIERLIDRDERRIYDVVGVGGLTKREWFAGQALSAILVMPDANKAIIKEAFRDGKKAEDMAAEIAYGFADAMIAAGKREA